MSEIKLKTVDKTIINGELITTVELNKIARHSCKGLAYIMSVIDGSDNSIDT